MPTPNKPTHPSRPRNRRGQTAGQANRPEQPATGYPVPQGRRADNGSVEVPVRQRGSPGGRPDVPPPASGWVPAAAAHTHTRHRRDEVEVRIIDGVECTDRAGIAEALAPRSTATLNTYASTDPNFPQPIRDGQRIDRRKWYRLADVQAYQQRLNQRREELKPPPVAPGNPNDMLDIPAAAEAIGVTVGRFRSYISASIPAWERGQDGYLPRPDEEEALGPRRTRRRWKRATLAAHRASRTGQGAPGAAGHPVGAPPHRRGRQPYSPELLTQVRQLEADAVAQGERLTGPQLADQLGVPVHTAYRLLTAAHTRIDGDDPKAD